MKTIKLLLLAMIATLISSCATADLKGLHSSNSIFKQPNIKNYSVSSNGLYSSTQKVASKGF
jgi:hypothetical protein